MFENPRRGFFDFLRLFTALMLSADVPVLDDCPLKHVQPQHYLFKTCVFLSLCFAVCFLPGLAFKKDGRASEQDFR